MGNDNIQDHDNDNIQDHDNDNIQDHDYDNIQDQFWVIIHQKTSLVRKGLNLICSMMLKNSGGKYTGLSTKDETSEPI